MSRPLFVGRYFRLCGAVEYPRCEMYIDMIVLDFDLRKSFQENVAGNLLNYTSTLSSHGLYKNG